MRKLLVSLTVLCVLASLAPAADQPDASAKEYQRLPTKVLKDPQLCSEKDVMDLIALGRESNRISTVANAIKTYLTQKFHASRPLLLDAADIAFLAGEFRAAASRYKSYLLAGAEMEGHQANEDDARASGMLCLILVDFTKSEDDAYRFLREYGAKFRAGAAGRKFDVWFLDRARRRDDVQGAAEYLLAALESKMPEEQEKLYYWPYLDWVMGQVATADKACYGAVGACVKIVPLIRGSKKRQAQFGFYAANLLFAATVEGKAPDVAETRFPILADKAKAYVDAFPTAEAVKDIMTVLAGKEGFSGRTPWKQKDQKQEFFVYAFNKIGDPERAEILDWYVPGVGYVANVLATPKQWTDLAMKHSKLFASAAGARHVALDTQFASANAYAALAKTLQNVPSHPAAVVNAVAAGGGDVNKALAHLVKRELWHVDPRYAYGLGGSVVQAFQGLDKAAKRDVPARTYEEALLAFGRLLFGQTPAGLFDPQGVNRHLRRAWMYCGKGNYDKARMGDYLKEVSWLVYADDRDRREAFNGAYSEFRNWAGELRRKRRQLTADEEAAIRLISPLEEAFRRTINRPEGDPAVAAEPLAKAMAQLELANKRGDKVEAAKAAQAAYGQLKGYMARKTPLGRHALLRVMHRAGDCGAQDLQRQIVADMLATYDPKGDQDDVMGVVAVAFPHESRRPWSSDVRNKAEMVKYHEVFAKALSAQIDKGQVWPTLLDWFRGTRRGRNWRDDKLGLDVMAKFIEKKALHNSPYRPAAAVYSATGAYMWLIRQEFYALNAKFPIDSYFDDMFIAEARKTGYLDASYWDNGKDTQKKVANFAAEMIRKMDRLPFGYNDEEKAYPGATFWTWQSHALDAEEKARDAMVAAIESRYGKTRFDTYAMGRPYFIKWADASKPDGRKQYFDRLGAYLDRALDTPTRLSLPWFGELEKLEAAKVTKPEADVLMKIFPFSTPAWMGKNWHYETLAVLLTDALMAQKREAELYRVVPFLWKIAGDVNEPHVYAALGTYPRKLLAAEKVDLALVYGQTGLELVSPQQLPESTRTDMGAVVAKALTDLGGIIPVASSDPQYAGYAAQQAWRTDKPNAAWETYAKNKGLVLQMLGKLDSDFIVWLIQRDTELGDHAAAEALGQGMILFLEKNVEAYTPETRARVLLAYADISYARQEYPKALAQYERIVQAGEFAGTQAILEAQLRVAEVYRQTRQFDKAIEMLEKLSRQDNRFLKSESNIGLAAVYYDTQDWDSALESIGKALDFAPDNAEAKILQGRIRLKKKEIEQVLDLDIGLQAGQKYIVPGRPLKVRLKDQNLTVVGAATEVQVVARTASGDEELFTLLPHGDVRNEFRGELDTVLGKALTGDHVLQVLGGDKITWDFSPEFRKSHNITKKVPGFLEVRTDADLAVSSGKLLSKKEREEQELEAQIRAKLRLTQRTGEEPKVALSLVRAVNQVKPGNKINVRVVDPDQSFTDDKDKVMVRVATTSGDTIANFPLAETDTHSGGFESAIPTAPSQAYAFATDSEEGKEPNFVISKKEYAPWVGALNDIRPKVFGVDLNDNVPLGKMTVLADVPGRKLKKFEVHVSLNAQDFQVVGAWPEQVRVWDGAPEMTLVRYQPVAPQGQRRGATGKPAALEAFGQYLSMDYIRNKTPKVTVPIKQVGNLAGEMGRHAGKIFGRDQDGDYISHTRVAFYQPMRLMRKFQLMEKDPLASYVLAVDGKEIYTQRAGDPRRRAAGAEEGAEVVEPPSLIELGKGVHVIEIYVCTTRKATKDFQLYCDIEKAPFFAPAPAGMFDPAVHPEIPKGVAFVPAEIAAEKNNSLFNIKFTPGTRARIVRLLVVDFETDAPAINKITLADTADNVVLPTKEDFMELRKNAILEIVPGDTITISYEDATPLTPEKRLHQARMSATYANGTVAACFLEATEGAQRQIDYIPMRRFRPGHTMAVVVRDPDGDVSDKKDVLYFTARSTTSKEPIKLEALETAEHAGIFIGRVFPVVTKSTKKSEITVVEGDDVILTYMDRENTDYGIPWERQATVEQVWWRPPIMNLYDVTSEPLPEEELERARQRDRDLKEQRTGPRPARARPGAEPAAPTEIIPSTRYLQAVIPEKREKGKPATLVLGGPLLAEVIYPAVALSQVSRCEVFLQTSAGRKAFGQEMEGEFDIRVPGTLRVSSAPSAITGGEAPEGYARLVVAMDRQARTPLDDGRFSFTVPTALGKLPAKSLALRERDAAGRARRGVDEAPSDLIVRGDDTIYIGLRYVDEDAKPDESGKHPAKWIVQTAELTSDAFLHVMDRDYREEVAAIYVGEKLYVRVVDLSRDITDEKERITVDMKTASGKTATVELTETYSHSGIFKGVVRVAHAEEEAAREKDSVAVVYGDKISFSYNRPKLPEKLTHLVEVHKGSDGLIVPFTKRFKDEKIGVQTQFMVAEAYFELAKRHRELGEKSIARREIMQGKKLLEEAIQDYPKTEYRAQAEYLLANLSLEFADEAESAEAKKQYYLEALNRFTDIVARFPDSSYAPKAQYKKALTFEKMGNIDMACEEYVKLSYRYPNNELVAETIARLGQYFLVKGKKLKTDAQKIEDPIQQEKSMMVARKTLVTAGQVFGRLGKRFPNHKLAGKTTVLSGVCFMEGEALEKAIDAFKIVIDDAKRYDKELVAESMYWCGDCYYKLGGGGQEGARGDLEQLKNAYIMFKKLTWDYPESKWAKFARGRLVDEVLIRAGEEANK